MIQRKEFRLYEDSINGEIQAYPIYLKINQKASFLRDCGQINIPKEIINSKGHRFLNLDSVLSLDRASTQLRKIVLVELISSITDRKFEYVFIHYDAQKGDIRYDGTNNNPLLFGKPHEEQRVLIPKKKKAIITDCKSTGLVRLSEELLKQAELRLRIYKSLRH